MRWVVLLVISVAFTLLTGGALLASAAGWGLPSQLDRPVSVREGSVGGAHHGARTVYFGSSRSHAGGGFHGGK